MILIVLTVKWKQNAIELNVSDDEIRQMWTQNTECVHLKQSMCATGCAISIRNCHANANIKYFTNNFWNIHGFYATACSVENKLIHIH